MDISMPRLNGIDATRRLKQKMRQVRIVALSVHEEDEMVEDVLEAGATCYVSKAAASEQLVRAVRGEENTDDEEK
jgi:two-component system NarL family response regulator